MEKEYCCEEMKEFGSNSIIRHNRKYYCQWNDLDFLSEYAPTSSFSKDQIRFCPWCASQLAHGLLEISHASASGLKKLKHDILIKYIIRH